jgi:hypothetical protein
MGLPWIHNLLGMVALPTPCSSQEGITRPQIPGGEFGGCHFGRRGLPALGYAPILLPLICCSNGSGKIGNNAILLRRRYAIAQVRVKNSGNIAN